MSKLSRRGSWLYGLIAVLLALFTGCVFNLGGSGLRGSGIVKSESRSVSGNCQETVVLVQIVRFIMIYLLHNPICKPNRLSKLHIVRAIALVLLRILVSILIALAILPVALLPVSTIAPDSILILFAMAEVALLVAVFQLGFTMRVVLAGESMEWHTNLCREFQLARYGKLSSPRSFLPRPWLS